MNKCMKIILKIAVIVPAIELNRKSLSKHKDHNVIYRVTFQVSYFKKTVRHNFAGARCRLHCGWNFLSSLARSADLCFLCQNCNHVNVYKLS